MWGWNQPLQTAPLLTSGGKPQEETKQMEVEGGKGGQLTTQQGGQLQPQQLRTIGTRVNIEEQKDKYVVTADLPAFGKFLHVFPSNNCFHYQCDSLTHSLSLSDSMLSLILSCHSILDKENVKIDERDGVLTIDARQKQEHVDEMKVRKEYRIVLRRETECESEHNSLMKSFDSYASYSMLLCTGKELRAPRASIQSHSS